MALCYITNNTWCKDSIFLRNGQKFMPFSVLVCKIMRIFAENFACFPPARNPALEK